MDESKQYLPVGFEVQLRTVDLGKCSVPLWQPLDPDALADAVGADEFDEDERFPYWAELWPSGVALARFLSEKGVGAGLDTLELGCGLGLAGVAAAMNGARVTFTDYEPDALAFARANHALTFGTPGATRLVDWRTPPSGLRAEMVLASDVLYEQRFMAPFLGALEAVLASSGIAYVAEPGRPIAHGTMEQLENRGFRHELHLVELHWGGRDHGVWVHEIHP